MAIAAMPIEFTSAALNVSSLKIASKFSVEKPEKNLPSATWSGFLSDSEVIHATGISA